MRGARHGSVDGSLLHVGGNSAKADRFNVVTSYNPMARDITLEDTGANTETDEQFIYNTYIGLLKNAGTSNALTTEAYEDRAKKLFKKQPANMKLLVVVDKLLTGFD